MALVSRAERYRRIAERTKILKRRGVVLTCRDLEDVIALIEAAEDMVTAEEDPQAASPLERALLPFRELMEES